MAIDYAYRDDWEETWKQGRSYFIHYAGGRATSQYPISRIFFDFLTESERLELMAAEEETKREALYLQKCLCWSGFSIEWWEWLIVDFMCSQSHTTSCDEAAEQ
jgi:hypothetical protein